MARFSRLAVYQAIIESGVCPIFYPGDIAAGKSIIDSLSAAGAKVLEMTNRGDFALEIYSALQKYIRERHAHLIFGAGTIVDAHTAALFIANSAEFIVSPVFDKETALFCNARKIAYLPGCMTATEIFTAETYGAEIVKIFPADAAGGPGFIKSLSAPSPRTRFMPTGGVEITDESFSAWFGAGATCVGLGSNLVSASAIENKDFKSVEANTRKALELAKKYSKAKP